MGFGVPCGQLPLLYFVAAHPQGDAGWLVIWPLIAFEQDALGGPFEVVVLPVPESPHEGSEAGQAQTYRNWHEEKEVDHLLASSAMRVLVS
jgi:hypothetical protein